MIIMQKNLFDLILVRPAVPENIGMAARAMKVFGFGSLTLVSPAFDWNPDGPAWKTACGARDDLAQVRVSGELETAVSSCHRVVGFSRREHDFDRPRCDLQSWADEMRKSDPQERIALVFGPEDFGLANADKQSCDLLVNIPTQHETLSLNLAQAVTIVLYELSRGETVESGQPATSEPMVTHDDIRRLVSHLTEMLDATAYFKEGRRERQIETLRNLILRLHLNVQEYGNLMGVLNALDRS